jgi:uncharacterized protein (TIGR02594 family)
MNLFFNDWEVIMSRLVVTASALNLRSNPSIEGGVIEILEKGDVVESIEPSVDSYWQKVRTETNMGWASLKYLQPYLPDAPVVGFPWFDIAMQELNKGVVEYPGSPANPRIVEYLRSTSLSSAMAETDETAWCSAFVNFCVEQAGFAGTDSALARSWLKWGREAEKPVVGCIVVFKRGEPPSGHVAFYVSEDERNITVLGGNQGNKVSIANYEKSRLLGFRVPR